MPQKSSDNGKAVETFSMDQATAMFRGGLIDDFTILRIDGAWSLALMVAGGKQVSPLRSAEQAGGPRTFLTLDDAILAAHQIGFDTRSLGIWRPLGPQVARMLASNAK